jgi:RNA polymerase sigma-70 factor (ECF subfamily)
MRNSAEADDVVQEAMMRAWSRRRSCNSPQAPIPWCLQITRHEAFRRLERRPGRLEQELVELSDGSAGEEPDHVINRIDVRRAVAQLERDEQILIALRYSRDYTQPEIARRLNIPEGTAKVRLHRVRKQLATTLQEVR